MAQSTPLEPFPQAVPGIAHVTSNDSTIASQTKRRRRGNSLPEDPRGDTDASSSLATLDLKPEDVTVSTPSRTPTRGHKRRKVKSMFQRWLRFSVRHTWVNPLAVMAFIISLYLVNPGPQNPIYHALFLSYPAGIDPETGYKMYGKGGYDFIFIAFYVVFFTFTREFLMQRVIRPCAIQAGIKSRAKQSRFMEQGYSAIYFAVSSPLGLYVMRRSPVWYFNVEGMYQGFPHREHEWLFKSYYLLQAAYWVQQAIVLLMSQFLSGDKAILQLEKPRKDFKEFVLHHVVTIALIWNSYRFHFAYMGIGVFFTHDISDFFLAVSKILNYLDNPYTAYWFGLFLCVWAYTRHYLNLIVIASVGLTPSSTFATVGPFELNWETQQYKCWISQYITFGLMATLQAVNILWFFLLLRIAKRVVVDHIENDPREEGEYDDENEVTETEAVAEKVPEKMEAPKLLVNGAPLEESDAVVDAIVNGNGSTTGTKKVEVSSRQRTTRSRRA